MIYNRFISSLLYFSVVMIICVVMINSVTLSEAAEDIKLLDDWQREIVLKKPAQRIISLAPSLTELLYSAQAGDKIVGVMNYSDYPPEALKLPVIANYNQLDLEAIVALKPDLIVAWGSGNPRQQLEKLMAIGLNVYVVEPALLQSIGNILSNFAVMAGTMAEARMEIEAYKRGLSAIKEKYGARQKVKVFYQVWQEPLMTINHNSLISDVISICGGVNVFAHLLVIAPHVSVEAVLKMNPDVIVGSAKGDKLPEDIAQWKQWSDLRAVKNKHLYHINPDHISRHSVRILKGLDKMCGFLELVRQRKA